MNTKTANKPSFNVDQLVSASLASKNFGELRKKAKCSPLFITDNGNVDTVLIGYERYEKMYQRLVELEEREETRILKERVERLESDPSLAISWRSIRRSGQEDE